MALVDLLIRVAEALDKRVRLEAEHPFVPSSRLVVAPDFKKHVYIEYDEIVDVRPLPARRRRAAN